MFYCVYVIENIIEKSLYIGFSSRLKERVNEHNEGKSRFTRGKGKWKLIYFEGYINKKDAISREKFLKGGSGRKYLNKQLKYFFDNQ